MNAPGSPLRLFIRPVAISLAGLVAAMVLSAPSAAFADRNSREGSKEQRYSQRENQRGTQRKKPAREERKYQHHEVDNRVRGFHQNPNRQPHYQEERLGFNIRF